MSTEYTKNQHAFLELAQCKNACMFCIHAGFSASDWLYVLLFTKLVINVRLTVKKRRRKELEEPSEECNTIEDLLMSFRPSEGERDQTQMLLEFSQLFEKNVS